MPTIDFTNFLNEATTALGHRRAASIQQGALELLAKHGLTPQNYYERGYRLEIIEEYHLDRTDVRLYKVELIDSYGISTMPPRLDRL